MRRIGRLLADPQLAAALDAVSRTELVHMRERMRERRRQLADDAADAPAVAATPPRWSLAHPPPLASAEEEEEPPLAWTVEPHR